MYIYQDPAWPNFTWDKDSVAARLVAVSKSAGFLAGRLSSIGLEGQIGAVAETVSQDIMTSYEIEGVQLNTDQVRSSVARRLGVPTPNDTPSSHYIDGIVEMMLDATTNYHTPLTDERLFGWHNCLFPNGRSGYTTINVAKYRSSGMKVVSGNYGRERVHYIAPEAATIPGMMSQFLTWFNGDNTGNDYIKSAIAHLWFVSIHPFEDGNGRIGRAIADMALSKAEGSSMRYFSMSRQINKDKKSYYGILEKTQNSGCDITPWLTWYMDCMTKAIAASDQMLSKVLDKASFWQRHSQMTMTDRQKTVLNIYLDGYTGKLTVKNWAKHAHISSDTAARDIGDLVQKDVLVPQEGRVRDISYAIRVSPGRLLHFGVETY